MNTKFTISPMAAVMFVGENVRVLLAPTRMVWVTPAVV